MGKIIQLFSDKLEGMLLDYKTKLISMPEWQIDSAVPKEIKRNTLSDKIEYLLTKYEKENPLFLTIMQDYINLKKQNKNLLAADLPSLSIDPRFLEGMGLNNEQIDTYFQFVDRVKVLLT